MTASLPLPGHRERARAGTALLIYGIVGVLLLSGLLVGLLVAAVRATDMLATLDTQRDVIVAALDEVDTALQTSETTLGGVSVSLDETGASLAEASVLASLIAPGTSLLADRAESFGVLGQRPFDGLAGPLRDVSGSLEALSTRLEAAGASITRSGPRVEALGERLGSVATRLEASRERLAAFDLSVGVSAVLTFLGLILLVLWLMVPAIAAIVIGRRWRQPDAG